MLLCSFPKVKTGSVFPTFCHATFLHALIMCCNVSRAEYNIIPQIYLHLILVKAISDYLSMAVSVLLSESLGIKQCLLYM